MSTENYLENYLYTKAAQTGTPISGTFELLPVCNLDCKMCYVKKSMSDVMQSGGLRSADEWIALGKKAVDAGMLFLLLTGGEPFLFPEFDRLYTSLHKLGLSIDINSNGTLINEEHLTWLKKNPPRHIKISLYGSSAESYQSLCGNGDAFNKVLRTFDLLKNAGIIVYSSITVTPHNYSELQEMLSICDDYKIPVKATSYMFPPHRSAQTHIKEKYRLTPFEAAKATLEIAKHSNDETIFYEKAKEYSEDCYQNYLQNLCGHTECGHMECRGGSCTFWITWEGKMLPCAMMDIGNYPVMQEHDFSQAWKQTKKLVGNITISPECTNCIARSSCYSCAASAYCETGDTKKRPDYPCELTSHYLKLMKQEHITHSSVEEN